jgi:predicted phage terminase large subunit-like protein
MTNPKRTILNAALRNDFTAFAERCFLMLNPGATYLPNWHIQALAYHLELVFRGEIRRLIVNMPPRSAKSLLCSVAFPAFVLGHDPRKRIIVASYGAELAIKLGNDCRTILQSAWYHRLFPRTRVSRIKNTEAEVMTTLHGFRMATSVGGTLTGRGGDLIIIDDPLKPQDAYSDSARESVNDWYTTTVPSRLDDKRTGAIVIVMQRLHPDDLTGTLLKSGEWTVLNLPAIAEQDAQILIADELYHTRKAGDPLHAEREPISVLDALRAELGADIFQAQYLQNPVAPGGNMIKRAWVRRHENPPVRTSSTHILQSYDTASKGGDGNDWSVCSTWQVHGGDYHLVDLWRERCDYPTLKARAIAHAQAQRPTKILIEDTGVGIALVPELRNCGFPAIAVPVEHNKQTRMSVQSAKFESGHVFFPQSAPWLETLEEELFAFPRSRHDDIVDSISQALGHQIQVTDYDPRYKRFGKMLEGMAILQYWQSLGPRE